jgi:diketogulonate reductase-like aldo/keto reductase
MTDTIGHVAAETAGYWPVEAAIDKQSVAEQLVALVREKGIAPSWPVHHPNVVAIPGARSMSQLAENVAAGDFSPVDDEVAYFAAITDRFRPTRHPWERACCAAMQASGRVPELLTGGGWTAANWRCRE